MTRSGSNANGTAPAARSQARRFSSGVKAKGPIALATIAALFALAACGAEETGLFEDDAGGAGGRAAGEPASGSGGGTTSTAAAQGGGASGGGAGEGGASTGTGKDGSCDPASAANPCEACVLATCCNEKLACDPDTPCGDFVGCADEAACFGEPDFLDCALAACPDEATNGAVSALQALAKCTRSSCEDPCGL